MPLTDMIVDGPSLYARCWHASQSQPIIASMKDPDGRPVGGCYIAVKFILSLMDISTGRLTRQPDRTLFCWDGESKTVKNRDEKPKAFYDEMNLFKQVLESLLNARNALLKAEADDIVATAAERSKNEGNHVFIVSGDKDLQQLCSTEIDYFCLCKKTLLRADKICEQWKVRHPSQIALVLALVGDSIDGISGVRGCGPKKAEKIFESVVESDFEKAFNSIALQLSGKELQEFYDSLDMTLLTTDMENVPVPSPVKLADTDFLDEVGLEKLTPAYLMAYSQYNDM
jgi:DNA polymerase I